LASWFKALWTEKASLFPISRVQVTSELAGLVSTVIGQVVEGGLTRREVVFN